VAEMVEQAVPRDDVMPVTPTALLSCEPAEVTSAPTEEMQRLERLHAMHRLRGFDKLQDLGFALTDITTARDKFYASHPEKRALSALEKLAAEEAFIESDHALISTSVCLTTLLILILILRRTLNLHWRASIFSLMYFICS
jgi:hypothetical protein